MQLLVGVKEEAMTAVVIMRSDWLPWDELIKTLATMQRMMKETKGISFPLLLLPQLDNNLYNTTTTSLSFAISDLEFLEFLQWKNKKANEEKLNRAIHALEKQRDILQSRGKGKEVKEIEDRLLKYYSFYEKEGEAAYLELVQGNSLFSSSHQQVEESNEEENARRIPRK